MSALHILLNGTHLGVLDGRGNNVRVVYDRDLDPDTTVPLSLSMPLTQTRWRGDIVRFWLTGLLPDRDRVLLRWRADFAITDLNPETLLAHVGEDAAGAAQFVREDRLDAATHRPRTVEPLSDDDIAGIAQAAKRDSLPYDPATETGRFSLAGAQAKFALQRTPDGGWALPSGAEPSTHIFKPAIPSLADQDVTEVASMQVAQRLGLLTAHTNVTDFAGERVICVERYDRYFADGLWWRVHQEDLCQAAGVDPRTKYESQGGPSAAACADLIRQWCGEEDVRRFAHAIMYNHLIKGSDAHARNFSLLITPGDIRLAPLYDLNTTLGFGQTVEARRAAMTVGGEDLYEQVGVGNWRLFASALHLDDTWVVDELTDMAHRLPDVVDEVSRDLSGIADTALARFRAGSEKWCEQVVRGIHRRTPGAHS